MYLRIFPPIHKTNPKGFLTNHNKWMRMVSLFASLMSVEEARLLKNCTKLFPVHKQSILQALQEPDVSDKSKKGGVDAPIAEMIELLNGSENYATTSSCSGRVSVFVAKPTETKSSGEWLFITHDAIESAAQVWDSLQDLERFPSGTVISFKFEPLVIHVMCKTLEAARQLHHITGESGFRNSGITVGKKKITLAIRNTILLDVPIAVDGKLLVTQEYLNFLVSLANEKFQDNQTRIDRLTRSLHKLFES